MGGEKIKVVCFHTTSVSDESLLAVLTNACQNARLVGVDFLFIFLFPFFSTYGWMCFFEVQNVS